MNSTNPNHHNTSKENQAKIAWFAANLPREYLGYPEQYLYNVALEVEELEDVAETRHQFKALLVERKVSEGMELENVDQKEVNEFMNPSDPELKTQRSEELVKLTQKYLEQKHEFTEASRLAFLELFHKEAPFKVAEMDESYFSNREFIEVDLKTYLEYGRGDSIYSLTTSNPHYSTSVLVQSGKMVKWNTYLKWASFALSEARGRFYVLRKLFQVVDPTIPDYTSMDAEYFNNPNIVRRDFYAYLLTVESDSLLDLDANNPKADTYVFTHSGEMVSWDTYLNRASKSLLGTRQSSESCKSDNPHRPHEALRKLLQIAGVEVPEYITMDEKYFSNPDVIKKDLSAYIKYAKVDSIESLGTHNTKCLIVTQNGEKLSWSAYLGRASGILLGTSNLKKLNNPHRRLDALRKLIRIVDPTIPEYIPMDEAYFTNPEYVKKDLKLYLQEAEGDSLHDLGTNTPKSCTKLVIQNGEKTTWGTYLNRASGVLLGTKQGWKGHKADNPHRPHEALRRLFQIAGVEVLDYISMDEAYFTNPEYVKKDLKLYLQEAKGDSLHDLGPTNPKPSITALAMNGEMVTWNTYLKRASKILLGTKKRGKNSYKASEIIKKLLEISGEDVPEHIPMDEKYFNNIEYVRRDLSSYLEHTKGNLFKDLTTRNPRYGGLVLLQSGEKMTWNTYLQRASGVLFGTTFKVGNRHRRRDALKELLRIVDPTIPEYIPMDEKYFNNIEYVKRDLNAYLKNIKGETFFDLSVGGKHESDLVLTQSGEEVAWCTYLDRASRYFFDTRGGKKTKNPHRKSDAIKKLLEIAGVNMIETIPIDETYFNNPEYVKADLLAYLEYAKCNALEDMRTRNPEWSTCILTQSGETVSWGTYLNRSSYTLLGTRRRTNNPHRPSKALKLLKEIANKANDK